MVPVTARPQLSSWHTGRHFAATRPRVDVDIKTASERANPGTDFIVTNAACCSNTTACVTLTKAGRDAVAVGKDRTPVTKRNRE